MQANLAERALSLIVPRKGRRITVKPGIVLPAGSDFIVAGVVQGSVAINVERWGLYWLDESQYSITGGET